MLDRIDLNLVPLIIQHFLVNYSSKGCHIMYTGVEYEHSLNVEYFPLCRCILVLQVLQYTCFANQVGHNCWP